MTLAHTSIPAGALRLERFESRRPELLGHWLAAADEFARATLRCAGPSEELPERVDDARPGGGFDVARTRALRYPGAGGVTVEATLTETFHPHDGDHWGVALRVVGDGDERVFVLASWGPSLHDAVSVVYEGCAQDPGPALAAALSHPLG